MNDLCEMKYRRDYLLGRKYEIRNELAQSKREWVTNRGGLSLVERADLEAEQAANELELHDLYREIANAEKIVKRAKDAGDRCDTFTAALIQILEREGLADLVLEAHRMADARLAQLEQGRAA